MSRYTDVDALEKSIRAYADRKFFCGEVELANGILKSLAMVKQAPTADVAQVVHGEWEKIIDPNGKLEGFIHKDCGRETKSADNFCPSCGARMDGCLYTDKAVE